MSVFPVYYMQSNSTVRNGMVFLLIFEAFKNKNLALQFILFRMSAASLIILEPVVWFDW